MKAEREILTSILKLTRENPTTIELIAKDSRVPPSILEEQIKRISDLNLVEKRGKIVKASPIQRLKIALKAIKLGADLEKVCRNLSWKEFEDIAVEAFQINGYSIAKHFRFRHMDKIREIDILAAKGKIIVCVDCKRWMKRLTPSLMRKLVENQIGRVKSLSKVFPRIRHRLDFPIKGKSFLIPVILSLIPSSSKCSNIAVAKLSGRTSRPVTILEFYKSRVIEYVRT